MSNFKKPNAYFLGDNQDLQFVFAKVKKLAEINKKILELIDPAIRRSCQVANMAGNKLIIITANSSVATQLRYQIPDMLAKMRQDPALKHVNDIQTKVGTPQTRLSQPDNVIRQAAYLSSETAQQIKDMAKSLDDKKLREVMEKIATRIGEKK